jgi:hypothetical protein
MLSDEQHGAALATPFCSPSGRAFQTFRRSTTAEDLMKKFTAEMSETSVRLEVGSISARLDFGAAGSTVFLTALDIVMLRGVLATCLEILDREHNRT